MIVKGLNPLRHSKSLDKDDYLEQEILLWSFVSRTSLKYPDSSYYMCMVEISHDGTKGTMILGGTMIRQKLSIIEPLTLDEPVAVSISNHPLPDGKHYNDIDFLNPDAFNDYFTQNMADLNQLSLPFDVQDTETQIGSDKEEIPY